MNRSPLMITAGGTGGHVFPALAVAECLQAQDIPVVWLGTRRGLEARLVPAAGIPIEWLDVAGLRGHGWQRRLQAPWMLLRALWQAMAVLRRVRPCAVLGMGGFVSGPGGIAARLLGIPVLIHEQNARPGMTNRWLARMCAQRVLAGFPDTFPQAVVMGNPVRRSITMLADPKERLAGRELGRLRVLVLGGSQGAQVLNETVPQAVALLPPEQRPQIWHQAGAGRDAATMSAYQAAGVKARIETFIEDMALAYGWADLVICRAGALTIAELAAAGIGSLLVPYPHAVDDHQTANARFLVNHGAAMCLPQSELNPQHLAQLLGELGADRQRVQAMATAARTQARPDAAQQLAHHCVEVAKL